MDKLKIYIDGSFNVKKNLGGYGLAIINDKDEVIYEEYKTLTEGLEIRNVYGEIVGACRAVEIALLNKYKEVDIYFDYEGIEKWAIGTWKRKNNYTIQYHNYMQDAQKHIKINYFKVVAHSGDRYNEMVDKLAKRGAGF